MYAAVFNAYLHQILSRGHSIEYFVEGGRSRSGRLLPAKGGMLAMTVNSYLHMPRRPIVFVPVYFGYEKLMEGDSFISELSGEEKKAKIKVDPTKTPAHIDITPKDGPEKDKTCPGVYKAEKGERFN